MNELDIDLIRRLIERSVRKVIADLEAEHRNNLRDFSASTDDEIVEYFYSTLHNSVYNTRSQMERRFYAGLTDNIRSNQRHHRINDYLCCCRVGTFAQGRRVLEFLGIHLGIHTGCLPDPGLHPDILADHTILYPAQRSLPGFID